MFLHQCCVRNSNTNRLVNSIVMFIPKSFSIYHRLVMTKSMLAKRCRQKCIHFNLFLSTQRERFEPCPPTRADPGILHSNVILLTHHDINSFSILSHVNFRFTTRVGVKQLSVGKTIAIVLNFSLLSLISIRVILVRGMPCRFHSAK